MVCGSKQRSDHQVTTWIRKGLETWRGVAGYEEDLGAIYPDLDLDLIGLAEMRHAGSLLDIDVRALRHLGSIYAQNTPWCPVVHVSATVLLFFSPIVPCVYDIDRGTFSCICGCTMSWANLTVLVLLTGAPSLIASQSLLHDTPMLLSRVE